jgi:hypothetical protein
MLLLLTQLRRAQSLATRRSSSSLCGWGERIVLLACQDWVQQLFCRQPLSSMVWWCQVDCLWRAHSPHCPLPEGNAEPREHQNN